MPTMMVTDFKAHCLSVLDKIATTGITVQVCRRGQPLVTVVSAQGPKTGKRPLGLLVNEAATHGDIVHFSGADDWESLK